MKNRKKHLYYLEELNDYKVAKNYSDVRGWSVKDSNNRVIGKVDNLLVNKELERVVYLDVEVDSSIIEANHDPYGKPENTAVHEFVNKEGENHIIIPIGLIDINEARKFVYTDTIDHQTFAETKRIKTGANIDRQYEETVLQSYQRNKDEEAKVSTKKKERKSSKSEDDKDFVQKELREEKQNLARERRELKEERKKLEQERLKLEEERQRNDPEFWSTKKREAIVSNDENGSEADTSPKDSSEGPIYDKNIFYERDEFDGSNYRNKKKL